MSRRGWMLAIVILLAVVYYAVAIQRPSGPVSMKAFAADRIAGLETQMWQAYYTHTRIDLFRLLVTTLREQYRYPYAKAVPAAFYLARAASRFSDMKSGYDVLLPDLQAAYTIARDWTGSRFDPAAVAKAELAWWVARRTPGENQVEMVGRRIAEEYALLYEVPVACVQVAADLRAQAAHLRDLGGEQADWLVVEDLLMGSYKELSRALTNNCQPLE